MFDVLWPDVTTFGKAPAPAPAPATQASSMFDEAPLEECSTPLMTGVPDAVEEAMGPAGRAPDPAAALLAFGHYGDEHCVEPKAPAVDRVSALPGPEIANAIRDMDDEQFDEVIAQVPDGDPASLEAIIQNCDDPARKLELWRAHHNARNLRDVEDLSPESEIGEDPDAQAARVRREQIVAETETELADEIAALEAQGHPVTLDEVDKLIARKELEHAIEMQHNLNLTSTGATRADGSRVVWTEEELRVVAAALEQSPRAVIEDPEVLTQIRRAEANAAGDNAQNDFGANTITLYDNGAKTTPDTAREHADPGLASEHGGQTSFMEHVMLHEIGHSAHDQDAASLEVYRQAVAHIPNAEHAEYFAQDFKNALLNPATHAVKSIDEPRAAMIAAQDAMIANPGDPAKVAAFQAAFQKMTAWQTMYTQMRNGVFHTDAREAEIIQTLSERGMDESALAEFRAKAGRLSTPEQVERLAEDEYGL